MIKTLSINSFKDLSMGTIKHRACVGFRNRRNLWNEIWSLDMYKEVMFRIELWHGDSGENLLTKTKKTADIHYTI